MNELMVEAHELLEDAYLPKVDEHGNPVLLTQPEELFPDNPLPDEEKPTLH